MSHKVASPLARAATATGTCLGQAVHSGHVALLLAYAVAAQTLLSKFTHTKIDTIPFAHRARRPPHR
eukprot:5180366-Amphidinium_carterae.1